MDTIEPAYGAVYLMVLFWSLDGQDDLRSCVLISQGNIGFPDMTLAGLKVAGDGSAEMVFLVPTTFYNPEQDAFEAGAVEVNLNRITLEVTATRR